VSCVHQKQKSIFAITQSRTQDKWQGTPYSDPKIDDIAFVEDLLDHLEATYCIDTERIWATGKSIGGGFCNVLACSALISTRIAAFAPVSGAFYIDNAPDNSDCDPPRAVTPILEFHGLADTTIAYTGGPHKGGNLPKILDWAAHWAARNECKEDPVITLLNAGSVKHYVWGCAGSATQHYAIAGLGHDWPSIEPNDDNPKGTVIDATPIIMEFFNQHSL
jgi:poly(3-hydroxybutyrate) depolymerase